MIRVWLAEFRINLADAIADRATRIRTQIHNLRERELNSLPATVSRDEALPRLQKTINWRQQEKGLAWANLFDAIARQIRPRP